MRFRRCLPWLTLFITLSFAVVQLSGCLPGATTNNSAASGGRLFNTPPTVVLSADIDRGIVPLTVNFSSNGSTDDSLIVSRLWDFGDGSTSRDISPSHTFRSAGTFTVTLTLTDDDGAQSSKTTTIYVTQAPVAVIKVDRTSADSAPAVFNFDGSASFEPDGTISAYQWDFGDGSRELLAVVAHTFSTPGTYRVRLTVTDAIGVTNAAEVIISVGIPKPTISFRLPPDDITNLAVTPASPLWVNVIFNVEPGVPRTLRAGLDGDLDPCDAQAVLYDAASGSLKQRLTGHAKPVTAVAYAPTSTVALTASQDDTVRAYNLSDRRPDGTLGTPTGTLVATESASVTSVAFSPDAARYVYGTRDGSVVMRDRATATVLWRSNAHVVAVNAVAFSADGTRVASAADDKSAIMYDAGAGQVLRVFGGTTDSHTDAVTSVAFSPKSADQILTGSADKTAKLWLLSQTKPLITFTGGHTDRVNAVAFSPDAQYILTGSDDTTARLWNIFGTVGVARTFSGHTSRVNAVAFSPDGTQALTGSSDGTAIVWDVATGNRVEQLAPCISPIVSVAYSPSGAEILLGVAALNDIRLDTTPANGNDLNLSVPAPLDLSVLTAAQYPAQYNLWAEIDTDRTEPVRTYATARINVMAPYTDTVTASTPRVPLFNDEAAILLAPTTNRQIFDLGPLRRGDRMFLSLMTVPGYSPTYNASQSYSVLVLDADQQMYAWYQQELPGSKFVLFSPDAKLIIGHDSPNYYVVVDGCQPPTCDDLAYGQSILVSFDRQVGVTTREQTIFLNFAGGTNVRVDDLDPMTIAPFKASQLNAAWADSPGHNYTAIIKNEIIARMEEIYADYDVVIATSDDTTLPTPPYQTVYFAGTGTDFYGVSSYVDPRNETLTGAALVGTESLVGDFASLTPEQMGLAIGNVAAHHVAHLLGLRHTEGGAQDLMDTSANDPSSANLALIASLLARSEEFDGQIGIQNAPQLLDETVGPHP